MNNLLFEKEKEKPVMENKKMVFLIMMSYYDVI